MTSQPQSAPIARNWKLTLAYDGTEFHGWQIQPGAITVQGELQAALGRVIGESPLPQGSGRTDAGVHAIGQVASFHLQANIPPNNLLRALNRTLPGSIRVLESDTVPDAFHARHSAVAKTYEYRIFRDSICPPFLARYVFSCPWPIDYSALQDAARQFVGEHDFLSFAATDPDLASRESISISDLPSADPHQTVCPEIEFVPKGRGTMRTIFSSAWKEQETESGKLLVYRVRGNGFLHHMVRNLVGTMIDVGRGRLHSTQIPAILAARARAAAGPTAQAQGLFLHSVEYDEDKFREK